MALSLQTPPVTEQMQTTNVALWMIALPVLVAGAAMFFIVRRLRVRHWAGVKSQANPGEFQAVWIDVLLQLFSALGILLMLTAGLLFVLWLRQ